MSEDTRSQAVKGLSGHDFSALLADPEKASVTAVRAGILFNCVGPSTVDGDFLRRTMDDLILHGSTPPTLPAKRMQNGRI